MCRLELSSFLLKQIVGTAFPAFNGPANFGTSYKPNSTNTIAKWARSHAPPWPRIYRQWGPASYVHVHTLGLEQLGSRKLRSLRHLLSTRPLLRECSATHKIGSKLLLPSQRQHTHLLRGPGDITVLANKTVPWDTNVRRFTTVTRDISVSGDLIVPLTDSPGLPPRVLAPALTPNVPVFQTRPFRGLDGLTLSPMPPCHIPINAILTGQAPITRPLIDVYSILTSDESDHALRPRDPTMLKT